MIDSSARWAQVLKRMRENKEDFLIGACSDLRDIKFTNDLIIINAQNQTVYSILKKHNSVLNKYAGGDYIQILLEDNKNRQETIRKLKSLFGEKLTVVYHEI